MLWRVPRSKRSVNTILHNWAILRSAAHACSLCPFQHLHLARVAENNGPHETQRCVKFTETTLSKLPQDISFSLAVTIQTDCTFRAVHRLVMMAPRCQRSPWASRALDHPSTWTAWEQSWRSVWCRDPDVSSAWVAAVVAEQSNNAGGLCSPCHLDDRAHARFGIPAVLHANTVVPIHYKSITDRYGNGQWIQHEMNQNRCHPFHSMQRSDLHIPQQLLS